MDVSQYWRNFGILELRCRFALASFPALPLPVPPCARMFGKHYKTSQLVGAILFSLSDPVVFQPKFMWVCAAKTQGRFALHRRSAPWWQGTGSGERKLKNLKNAPCLPHLLCGYAQAQSRAYESLACRPRGEPGSGSSDSRADA